MGWSLPYGYVWAEGGRIRKATDEEMTAAAGPSAAPDEINAPPTFLDDNENIYKDENGVIRNRKRGAPSPYQMSGGKPSAYSPSAPRAPAGGYGGDGGRSQYSGMGGGGGAPGAQGSTVTVTVGNPWSLPTFQPGGGAPGGGGGGGGGMAVMQDTRISSKLDPGVWNTPVNYGSTSGAAGQAGGYAAQLGSVDPNVAGAPRTLYDRYQQHLMDPSSIMGDQGFQFALDEAQKATQRQLNAGRMRNSGNALRAMSDTTTGTILNQFRNLADVYGAGAGMEGQRYAAEQGLGLDAQKLKMAALQGAGDLAVRSGQLYGQTAAQGIAERELDLKRAQANILTPNQQQAATIYSQAVNQANQAGNYGTFSPSLSQQYLSLTGTPLSLKSYLPNYGGGMFDFSGGPRIGYY